VLSKRLTITAVGVVGLVVFLAVKIRPPAKGPAIEIRTQGADGALARRPLAAELHVLFRDNPSGWRVNGSPADARVSSCLPRLARSGLAGTAITASYLHSRNLEIGLAGFAYVNARLARESLPVLTGASTETCLAGALAADLRHEGYTAGPPRGYTAHRVAIGDAAIAVEIEVPSRYKGRPYTWKLDTIGLLRHPGGHARWKLIRRWRPGSSQGARQSQTVSAAGGACARYPRVLLCS
jgi:hypothetical protein